MRVCVGCSFSRDAKGNPDKMELKYAEMPREDAVAVYGKFTAAANKLHRMQRAKNKEAKDHT